MKQVFLEPLKKVQVEGFVMCAEPEVLFGNLDELCCVTYAFCKEFINLLIDLVTVEGSMIKYFDGSATLCLYIYTSVILTSRAGSLNE